MIGRAMLDKRFVPIALGLVALSAAQGCGFALVGSKKDFENFTKAPLAKTASFDLGCPADQLTYSPLGTQSDGYDKVGVTGCSKKATYVFINETWLKASETDTSK